jgi:ribosomal 30S subunit maturation factor RimM
MVGQMSTTFVKVGRIGKTHGLKGELKITIDDPYFDDLMGVDSLLVAVGRAICALLRAVPAQRQPT